MGGGGELGGGGGGGGGRVPLGSNAGVGGLGGGLSALEIIIIINNSYKVLFFNQS